MRSLASSAHNPTLGMALAGPTYGKGESMLALPDPVVNGHRLSHSELRALHRHRREVIAAATCQYFTDGPRLLRPQDGEKCSMRVYGRDRTGNLLADVTVALPTVGETYTRKIRLVPWANTDLQLRVRVARDE